MRQPWRQRGIIGQRTSPQQLQQGLGHRRQPPRKYRRSASITRASVNTFEMPWIENRRRHSPTPCTLPSTVATARPNICGSALAST
jgi:hypothetical protein